MHQKNKEWDQQKPRTMNTTLEKPFTTTKGVRGKSKGGRHQTHYVYRSNRTIPGYVQSGQHINNGPL